MRPMRSLPTALPPDRGRLMTAAEIATELMRGSVSPTWVRRHVGYKVRLGHRTVLWYEADVRAWMDQQREVA